MDRKNFVQFVCEMTPNKPQLFEWPWCPTYAQKAEIFHELNTALQETGSGLLMRSEGKFVEVEVVKLSKNRGKKQTTNP